MSWVRYNWNRVLVSRELGQEDDNFTMEKRASGKVISFETPRKTPDTSKMRSQKRRTFAPPAFETLQQCATSGPNSDLSCFRSIRAVKVGALGSKFRWAPQKRSHT